MKSSIKKILKWTGLALGAVFLLIGAFVAYSGLTPMKTFPVQEVAINLPTDSTALAFGSAMVLTDCAYCHMDENGTMGGRLFNRKEDPFGEMWSANISQHPTKGIGRYTDGELAYLIRTGINREGRFVGHMMTHPNMSDEHLASVIAFLRSDTPLMHPVEAAHPLPEYTNSALVKALVRLGVFPLLSYEDRPVAAPLVTDKMAYGRYLANEVWNCASCHSASFDSFNPANPEMSPGFYGGGNPIANRDFVSVPSANLTPVKQFGLGDWTEEQFLQAVKFGIRKDGTTLANQMPRFALLSDEDIQAVWAYLQTVPVLDNEAVVAAK